MFKIIEEWKQNTNLSFTEYRKTKLLQSFHFHWKFQRTIKKSLKRFRDLPVLTIVRHAIILVMVTPRQSIFGQFCHTMVITPIITVITSLSGRFDCYDLHNDPVQHNLFLN